MRVCEPPAFEPSMMKQPTLGAQISRGFFEVTHVQPQLQFASAISTAALTFEFASLKTRLKVDFPCSSE